MNVIDKDVKMNEELNSKEEERKMVEEEEEEEGEEGNGEKFELFLKRNLWWLKKRWCKCIWLIYIKMKYCWKEDELVLSIFEVVLMEEEVELDDF